MKTVILLVIVLLFLFCLRADIINPDRPEKGDWNFKMEKLWEVNRAGGEVIGQPLQVLVAENGNIVVYDAKFGTNRLFAPEGKYITSFGKRGEGPGEIKNQAWMYAAAGKLLVPDGGKVHYLNEDGTYDQSLKKPFGLNAVFFLNEFEFIAAPLTLFQMTGGKARISRYNLKNHEEKTIADFNVFEGGMGSSGKQVYNVIMPGLSPMMTVGYHDGRLYYGMNNSYTVHMCDLEGKPLGEFSLKRKKRLVSIAEKKKRFENSQLPDDALKQIVDSLPDEIACFDRIEVHNGLIFVFVADLEHWKDSGRKPKQIDIFSPEGKYFYRSFLRFEEGSHLFSTPFCNIALGKDYLIVALEDNEGEVKLFKYHIVLPEN